MTEARSRELQLTGTPRVAVGCEKCRGTGYSGRIGVFSFLDITDDVAEAIRLQKGEEEIERCARRHGFQSLGEAAMVLVEQWVTTFEEAERVVGFIEKQSDGKGSFHLGQSGHEFVGRLRGNKQTKDLPVLMLTAANTEQSELESITRGADDFLAKTSSVNVLLARARRLIERAQTSFSNNP